MNALRMSLVALAIAVVGGMDNRADADWVVRVEMQNMFTGSTYYPTLYTSPDKKEAQAEYAYLEKLMKLYPTKFRNEVLNEMGIPFYYSPVRLHLVYLQGIFPTGRP